MTLGREISRVVSREVEERALAAVAATRVECAARGCQLTTQQWFVLATVPLAAFLDLQQWLGRLLAGLTLDTDAPIDGLPTGERIHESDGA